MRCCTKCKLTKEDHNFYVSNGRQKSWCKLCCQKNARDWNLKNPERANLRIRKWQRANPDKLSEWVRSWQRANMDKVRGYVKKWASKNPEKTREYARRRRARLLSSLGWLPPYYESILFGEQEGKCNYCQGDLEKLGFTLDHIIPLSRNGKHSWENVCLACPSCNFSKHIRTGTEYLEWLN